MKVAGEDLNNDQEYRIVTLDFLAGGGDNIFETTTDFISLDTQDEVLVAYVKEHSPLDVKLEERIVATNETASDGSSDDKNSESNDGGGEESNDDNGGTNTANIAKAPVFAALVAVTVALVMM